MHDAETVDATPAAPGELVDMPGRPARFAVVVGRSSDRRPIVPAVLRSRDQRRQLVGWAARLAVHSVAYHVTRCPKYGARVAVWAPVGVLRTAGRLLRWASAEQGNWHLRQQAATRGDHAAWLALDRQRQTAARWRWPMLAAGVLAVTLAVVLAVTLAPSWVLWVALALAVPILAWVGRPADRPITDRVSTGGRYIRLTAQMTRGALVAANAGVKDPSTVRFVREIYRDGPGHTAVVDLPAPVIALDVVDRRDRLAAGLRLPVDQVWPQPMRGEHPGRLLLWVADRPVSAMRRPAWPLASEGSTDYFSPFAYGTDVRLRPVTWSLAERNSLFGGVPGSGKSLAARVVLLGAVLDPLVIPAVSELKGTGDFDCFEALCPPGMYVCGADDGAVRRTLAVLEWLHHECEVRPPLIAAAARSGLSPTRKLTRPMAADARLHPIVAVFDEFQEVISHPEVGKHAGALLLSVIKRGRALGIHVIVATQRFDKDSLPKAISSLVTNRACLAVPAQPETDMVLGTSAYKTGARPTAFTPGDDAGWMVRAGFTAGFETIRASYMDDRAAAAVCARALAMREGQPGTAGPVRARNLADDVRTVWPAGATGWWLADILAALVELDDATYGQMSTEALSAALRAAGLRPVSIHRKISGRGVTRYGVRRADLAALLDSRVAAIDSGADIASHQRTHR